MLAAEFLPPLEILTLLPFLGFSSKPHFLLHFLLCRFSRTVRLLDIVSTLPVVHHHLVPDPTAAVGRLTAPLPELHQVPFGVIQRLLGLLAHIDYFVAGVFIIFQLLLLLDEVRDFFDVDSGLLHDFFVLARERDLKNLHQGTSLLHLDVETLNVTQQFVKVGAHFSGRVIGDISQPVFDRGQPFLLLVYVSGNVSLLHDV